jgi:hypothetical protein
MENTLKIIDKYLADPLLESSNPINILNRIRKEVESLGQLEPLVMPADSQAVQGCGKEFKKDPKQCSEMYQLHIKLFKNDNGELMFTKNLDVNGVDYYREDFAKYLFSKKP